MRDKFLTEAMGGCAHEWEDFFPSFICRKCDADYEMQIDFSTWEGFGKLWEWSNKQSWWNWFWVKSAMHIQTIINPENFANALHEFLINKDKNKVDKEETNVL